jgi:hypothetical protein
VLKKRRAMAPRAAEGGNDGTRARVETNVWMLATAALRRTDLVDQNIASWNRIARWLGPLEALRAAA